MDIVLIGLFIIALGCIALLHRTGYIDVINDWGDKEDKNYNPHDIPNSSDCFKDANIPMSIPGNIFCPDED